MADVVSIPPSNLLVDETNPRLSQPNEGQREAMRAIAKSMPSKVLRLARDVVENGLNPADLPIVMPGGEGNRYIVLEGNRRLVALKALENPDSFVGAVDGGTLAKLRELAQSYQESPTDLVQCLVVKKREDADHWIHLRHTGENEGAGIVGWGYDEQNRFKARSGAKDISTQALDFAQRLNTLSAAERGEVPASNLRRLLGTPEVREKIGLGLEKGELKVLGDPKKVAKAIKHLADDLSGPDGTKVGEIYTADQRKKYAQKIPASVAVPKSLKKGRSIESTNGTAGAAKLKPAAKPKTPKKRDHLIPHDCVMVVAHARMRAIEVELRSLSLETYTNAVGVMLRVFVELSMDEYIDKKKLAASAHDKLRIKMEAVVKDLIAKNKLTVQQAKPVRKAMQAGSYLGPSLDLMHDYIHNQDVFPAPSDLRAHWDSLQPFMAAVWSV
jgi:hypothetical protein